jgi:hypothetical protein
MFEYLPEVCKELNANMQELYWILIVPFTLLTIIFEFFKLPEGNPNVSVILKRVVISIILLSMQLQWLATEWQTKSMG